MIEEEGFIANYEDIVVKEEDVLAENIEITIYNIQRRTRLYSIICPDQYLIVTTLDESLYEKDSDTFVSQTS